MDLAKERLLFENKKLIWSASWPAPDYRTNTYFLIDAPMANIIIVIAYLAFVFYFGPRYMRERKPMNLDREMMIYNLFQIISCSYIVYETYDFAFFKYSWSCEPMDYTPEGTALTRVGWLYYLLKIIDLLDTVFMVLKKKYSQITFLHVYHHGGMVISTWAAIRYGPGGHSIYVLVLNSIVHIVMYGYYFGAAWNRDFWLLKIIKKRITQIQLVQFFMFLMLYVPPTLSTSCQFPKAVLILIQMQSIVFLIFFSNFYIKSYKKNLINAKNKLTEQVPNKSISVD